MIDINVIRERPEWAKEQLAKLYDPEAAARVDVIARLDQRRRELLTQSEALQAARNKLNRAVGMLRGDKKLDDPARAAIAERAAALIAGGAYDEAAALLTEKPAVPPATLGVPDALDALMKALGGLGDQVAALNDQVNAVDAELAANIQWIPNFPHESVIVAPDETHNVPHPMEGKLAEFDFDPKPHWDLAAGLGIIDFERGVKLAGARGYILVGMGARLQRALINFFLDQARAHGFTEFYLPMMVREEALFGSGQFPKFRDNVYYDQDADVYLVPTAEIPLTNMHSGEILDEAQLPLYYAAHTTCFRREKMSAGRDVRGIKRVHQFEKVELYKFTTPETSYDELESLTEAAADVIRALKLPFRRLEIVSGDLGFSASKKYDLEIWSPGCAEWLEVSSCSNTEEFQARRANIKYRPSDSKKTRFVHTLNGSGLATPRVLIAIMETYQQADGSIIVPEVLRPYLGGIDVITREGR